MGLHHAALTLALAAMVAGIAWVYTFRPLPQLRFCPTGGVSKAKYVLTDGLAAEPTPETVALP